LPALTSTPRSPAHVGRVAKASVPRLSAATPTLYCDSGEPVEVCVQYYQYLGMCFGQDLLDEACQAGLIPDGAADLASIEMLCAVNLERIRQACR
jgi:hypothetical protein